MTIIPSNFKNQRKTAHEHLIAKFFTFSVLHIKKSSTNNIDEGGVKNEKQKQ